MLQRSALDTSIIYCGDCLDQLRKLPGASIDLIYIDPPFNSNRNYELFWGETKEKRAFDASLYRVYAPALRRIGSRSEADRQFLLPL
jgi:DNA modification methylase